MATVKAVSSKAGINQALDYVTNEKKTESHLVSGINCSPESVKDEMQLTKEMWGKTEGRTYKHFTQSWHKDDPITPELAHRIGCETAAKISAWAGFEVLIATHIDREYIHNHFIVNSVSFETGKKLQWSTADLYQLRSINDQLCQEHDLHICQKGKTFEGEKRTAPSTYTKEAHHELKAKDSYILQIGSAVAEARAIATSRDDFQEILREKGIGVTWTDSRKYITFTDLDRELEGEMKCKVRDKKLSQTVHQDIGKESLERDFERNAQEKTKAAAKAAKEQAAPPTPSYSFDAVAAAFHELIRQNDAMHDKRKPADPAVLEAPERLQKVLDELEPAYKAYSHAEYEVGRYKMPWQKAQRAEAIEQRAVAYQKLKAVFDSIMAYGVSSYHDGVKMTAQNLYKDSIDVILTNGAWHVQDLQRKAAYEVKHSRPANVPEASPEALRTAQTRFKYQLGTIPSEEQENVRDAMLEGLERYSDGSVDSHIARSEIKQIIFDSLGDPTTMKVIEAQLEKDLMLAFSKNEKNQAEYKKLLKEMDGRER